MEPILLIKVVPPGHSVKHMKPFLRERLNFQFINQEHKFRPFLRRNCILRYVFNSILQNKHMGFN